MARFRRRRLEVPVGILVAARAMHSSRQSSEGDDVRNAMCFRIDLSSNVDNGVSHLHEEPQRRYTRSRTTVLLSRTYLDTFIEILFRITGSVYLCLQDTDTTIHMK